MVQVFTETFVSMIANILAIIFSLKLSSKTHLNAPIFGFCFALSFLKVPYFVSFYLSFSCLYLILCAFCGASAGEEMQTRRPSAAIAVMIFRISSRDTIFSVL